MIEMNHKKETGARLNKNKAGGMKGSLKNPSIGNLDLIQ
jgi:hypothetical protein